MSVANTVAANTNIMYVHPATASGTGATRVTGAQVEDGAVVTSYVQALTASTARVADTLSWPIDFLPMPMTCYSRFVESGNRILASSLNTIWMLSNASGDKPRALSYASTGTTYRIGFQTAAQDGIISTTASPTLGQLVELATTLDSTGVVRSSWSIDNSGPVAEGPLNLFGLPSAFATPTILSLASGGTVIHGELKIIDMKIAPGNLTLQQMREIL
jgi:hypothetical protein